jgi:hypothetical protein
VNHERKNRFALVEDDNAHKDKDEINEDVRAGFKIETDENPISKIKIQPSVFHGSKSVAVVIASLVIALAVVFLIINYLYKKPNIFTPSEKSNILSFI